MSSILTNTSAMVALQTLKGINKDLAKTQDMISTGKKVATAKDNAAYWAVSKVMEADVKGFKSIQDSLGLGDSSVAVARNAAEGVTDLLTQMKERIVGAQGENIDRTKLQADIDALADQIASVTGAAQFNGLNMLSGQDDVSILSALNRASDGSVTAADITVQRQDMTFDAGVMGTIDNALVGGGAVAAAGAAADGTGTGTGGNVVRAELGANRAFDNGGTEALSSAANSMNVILATNLPDGGQVNLTIAGVDVIYQNTSGAAEAIADVEAGLIGAINAANIEGISAAASGTAGTFTISSTSKFDDVEISGQSSAGTTIQFDVPNAAAGTAALSPDAATLQARASELEFNGNANVSDGDGYRVTIGGGNYDYIAGKNETMEDVVKGLKLVIDSANLADISTRVVQEDNGNWTLQIDNDGDTVITTLEVQSAADGTATGGLVGLDKIDVSTNETAEAALANIETWIGTSIDAASAFGSAAGRIETQSDFVSNLIDSLKTGIGTMVDANMEEASARLQALQVQQQLATQSLSIANQAPQNILALFR